MRRGFKIALGVLVALLVLVAPNAVVTSRETEPAEVTVAGGKILKLSGGEVQAVDRGPRDAPPIVLIHCFTCAIDWWDEMMPSLERAHRVVAIDLLGHGGSEKPSTGYAIPDQADVVAEALGRLGVEDATVVGHSIGGTVSVALTQRSPQLVDRVVIIDTGPTHEEGDLGLIARLGFAPVIGESFWRLKPDIAVRKGLEVAFAPGFDVPDAFVDDVGRMTFTAYDDSPSASEDFGEEESLDSRLRATGKPLLVIMGEEEQIIDDPAAALAAYAAVGAKTVLLPGAGHSPNVEKPKRTAALVLSFAGESAQKASARHKLQGALQKPAAVRRRP